MVGPGWEVRRAAPGSQLQPHSFPRSPWGHSCIHLGILALTHSSFPFSHSSPGSPPQHTVFCTLPRTDNIPTRLQPLVGHDLPQEAGALSAMTCPQLCAWPWLTLTGKHRVGCFVHFGGRTHSSGYDSGMGSIGKISARGRCW